MVAFHGKQEVKDFYLDRVRNHRAMDQLRQSFGYWEKDAEGAFRGCAVGCTLHSSDHGAYETELGIPRILARVEDGIFESLPADRAQSWPEEFLNAAQPGADLSSVWSHFAAWLMLDDKWGVINFAKTDRGKNAVRKVGDLYRRQSAGDTVGAKEFADAAYAAAGAAAAYAADADAAAADAAAYAADADAADAAAYAADADAAAAYAADADAAYAADAADAAAAYAAAYAAVADAAYAAAAAAAYAAAADACQKKYRETRHLARLAQADKLLELMAAAPVAVTA